MIETRFLTKTYKDLVAVNKLNLKIEKGDVYGFIGPNGAGKTTTMKILATLMRPTSGRAYVCGLSVEGQARHIRHKIGYMPDFFGVYDDMSVVEYLEFFASFYRITGARRKQVVSDVLALTDLEYKRNALIDSLSRGMQQRLGLARVLLHDPEVLLLDEPASGLDPRARIEIRELLKELKAMGKTILISSHILVELATLCNKVGIIERGQLLYSGPITEILAKVKRHGILHLRVSGEQARAVSVLSGHPRVHKASLEGELVEVELAAGVDDIGFISELLVKNDLPLTLLKEEDVDLEDAFMRVTKGLVA